MTICICIYIYIYLLLIIIRKSGVFTSVFNISLGFGLGLVYGLFKICLGLFSVGLRFL